MPSLFSRRPSTPGLLAALCLLASPPRSVPAASSATPASRLGKITGRPAQLALAALIAAVAQSPLQSVHAATESVKMSAQAKGSVSKREPVHVLMIGDSMSVGGFGDALQEYLQRNYGRVALYASCGSSPESWLRGETFVTKCGYRARTPSSSEFTDYGNGHKPTPTLTPKLEDLLRYHTPSVVIIQLGTNWMDGLESKSFAAEAPKYRAIMERFAEPLQSARSVKQIFWIPPPDSSRYSTATQQHVEELICKAAEKYHYVVVKNALPMTHYIAGHTGSDGVHYRKEDAYAWAEKVERFLRGKVR